MVKLAAQSGHPGGICAEEGSRVGDGGIHLVLFCQRCCVEMGFPDIQVITFYGRVFGFGAYRDQKQGKDNADKDCIPAGKAAYPGIFVPQFPVLPEKQSAPLSTHNECNGPILIKVTGNLILTSGGLCWISSNTGRAPGYSCILIAASWRDPAPSLKRYAKQGIPRGIPGEFIWRNTALFGVALHVGGRSDNNHVR
jgi:hypothetical protein